jgi:hypothetical protein
VRAQLPPVRASCVSLQKSVLEMVPEHELLASTSEVLLKCALASHLSQASVPPLAVATRMEA